MNQAKGAVKSSAPRSNVDAAIALAPALLPLSHQHSSLLARTSPACAGNWGIVRTPLGLVYPSWSKVGAPAGRTTFCHELRLQPFHWLAVFHERPGWSRATQEWGAVVGRKPFP
jgi:hypothetical protein